MKTGGIVENGGQLPPQGQHNHGGMRAEGGVLEMEGARLLCRCYDNIGAYTWQRRGTWLLVLAFLPIRRLAVRTAGMSGIRMMCSGVDRRRRWRGLRKTGQGALRVDGGGHHRDHRQKLSEAAHHATHSLPRIS